MLIIAQRYGYNNQFIAVNVPWIVFKGFKCYIFEMRGFTLVELSIVILVIGLLAGGVLVGRDMIEAARTRSLITDVEQYRTSLNVFRDKYLAIPGDMKNATQFWGKDNGLCAADTGAAVADGTCNGDGNRMIPDAEEAWHFWKHLNKADLIKSSITTYDFGSGDDMIVGVNVPESAFNGAGFRVMDLNIKSGELYWYDGKYGHVLRLGRPNNGVSPTSFNRVSEMTPTRVVSMENKIDDGKPGTGIIRTSKPNTASGVTATSCTDDEDPAASMTATYRTNMNSEEGAECTTVFLLDF